MSSSVNKVTLIANLGADPEVRRFPDNGKIVTMSVATSDSWKDKKSGERVERVSWHRVAILNEGLAGVAEQYLRKGSKVYLEGQLETRKWTDKETGEDRYATEIVLRPYTGVLRLLDKKPENEPERPGTRSAKTKEARPAVR